MFPIKSITRPNCGRRFCGIQKHLCLAVLLLTILVPLSFAQSVPPPPQGAQTDASFADSFRLNHVTNVFATTQKISCYTPEVPYSGNLGPTNGYTGETPCNGSANTGEDLGPYRTQNVVNQPLLVNNHSESDLRVDPTNPNHLIGQTKWFVSAEGYDHLLGFYESMDGGATWPVQGHVPGYEGWTDNTDPVGAFDQYGNFYALVLPYQFFFDGDSHSFQINKNREPNPSQPAEVISASVRPQGSTTARQWLTTHDGQPDSVAPYHAQGREPDKQWIAIDTNPGSPFLGRIY